MMKRFKSLMKQSVLVSCLVFASISPVFAVDFSPYADMTINATWSSLYNDMEPMDLAAISKKSGVKNYHLAFITDAGSCNPAWGSQSSYSVNQGWGQHLTDNLRNNKISFSIAFGGAAGDDLSKACTSTQLVSAYEKIITTYQPQGLDFDIENGSADVNKIMSALQKIQATYPSLKLSFTLPVMPEGLTTDGQFIINQAKIAGLHYNVNIMAMDYGPVGDMGQYATQAATSLFSYLRNIYSEKPVPDIWRMVEVTPMIGINDVSSEHFTLRDVDTLKTFANQNGIGGLAMWSVARDNPCDAQYASPVCSGKDMQTVPYEFSQRFLQ